MVNFKNLKPILIFTIIIGLLITLATICDDDELKIDFSCNLNYLQLSYYNNLLNNAQYTRFLSYDSSHPLSNKQFILYVAMQEKSPPETTS